MVLFPPIFVAGTTTIYSYHFVAPLIYSVEIMSQFRFDSKKFSLFSREYCLVLFAFAKSFENVIVKQRISFFNTSHFTWSQYWLLWFNSPLTLLTNSFSLKTYSSLEIRELLNFQRSRSSLTLIKVLKWT